MRGIFWDLAHASTDGVAKESCHATILGVAGLGYASCPRRHVVGHDGLRGSFGHAEVRGMTECFCHTMRSGVAKYVKIENKVMKELSLKYY